ncbi:class I SAM-dependent methyltransferase [Streptomyces tuirus]|uniref:Class I SAM-dependent methyltransferase n=1 Tax=Streptomyces tuirus TaxID=68278 RepID=A0A941FAG0_9ACTN|nr:class I SAM-dependent methyltransferase [Streptomyces tuirus]
MTTGQNTVGDVFSAGAEEFHRWSERLWDPIGEATADAAVPADGESVLDACCGAGASALPAARAVGPAGRVDAVDLADGLLAIGERRAREEHLRNISFHHHDVTSWPAPGAGYDVVQCALGVFFFPDMDRDSAALTRKVRPGGRFVVTVWEKGSLAGWQSAFRGAVLTERDLPRPPQMEQLARIDTADTLAAWLGDLGGSEPRVVRRRFDAPLTPESAWVLATGSGTRRMLDGLSPAAVERVRTEFTARLTADAVDDLDVRVLTGTARFSG